ncbi:hypothetical protein [Halopiger xanaduensis]|uniref:DUF8135 domain-containing protein n=1 Tax=Halopiger xanaduensis (strain DSM 18323 / JCM 14033 / SH-6) TaxID=797210 RepID=F8D352_HALXS|nr:hypothetical protein [Halopiger xanaduensis]AEH37342.1 hypothetical protein Halxa_2725 [Halopiger xanaduensis SH-6]
MSDGADSSPGSSSNSRDDGELDPDREREVAVDYDGFDALPDPGATGSRRGVAGDENEGREAGAGTTALRSDSDARADESPSSHSSPGSTTERTGPLGDLAAAVDERSADRDGADDAFDDLFEREDVTTLDPDRLWERLENDEPLADQLADDREIREIDKHEYCHQCEHFADPPGVDCTREGTDILELASLDTFRVADCPVVLENEELERRY